MPAADAAPRHIDANDRIGPHLGAVTETQSGCRGETAARMRSSAVPWRSMAGMLRTIPSLAVRRRVAGALFKRMEDGFWRLKGCATMFL